MLIKKNFFNERKNYKTKIILLGICIFALLLAPVITPVASDDTKTFADEESNCPGCWAWNCTELGGELKICAIACLYDEPENGYYFGVEIRWWDVIYEEYIYDWQWILMVEGITFCDEGCNEYTASMYPQLLNQQELTGRWKVKDGLGGDVVCERTQFGVDPRL